MYVFLLVCVILAYEMLQVCGSTLKHQRTQAKHICLNLCARTHAAHQRYVLAETRSVNST